LLVIEQENFPEKGFGKKIPLFNTKGEKCRPMTCRGVKSTGEELLRQGISLSTPINARYGNDQKRHIISLKAGMIKIYIFEGKGGGSFPDQKGGREEGI